MKTALLFGASGLVGSHVLSKLISNNKYSKIKLFVRSSIDTSDPKIEIIQTDFNNLENHKEDIKGDDCFFCIGTTKKNSPDKNEYKRVELDVPKQIAQITKSNSVNSFVFISSGYADPKSSGDYLKFKGEVEEELKRLNFPKLGIMRPSFLLGDRKEKRIGPKNRGDNSLNTKIPIFSPILFSFRSPNKKEGLIIPSFGKLSLFNSSSTSPLNFK